MGARTHCHRLRRHHEPATQPGRSFLPTLSQDPPNGPRNLSIGLMISHQVVSDFTTSDPVQRVRTATQCYSHLSWPLTRLGSSGLGRITPRSGDLLPFRAEWPRAIRPCSVPEHRLSSVGRRSTGASSLAPRSGVGPIGVDPATPRNLS